MNSRNRSCAAAFHLLLVLLTLARVASAQESPASVRLWNAAIGGNPQDMAAALFAGADANMRNKDGVPVLAMAVNSGNPEAVRTLLNAGATSINERFVLNRISLSPLSFATWNGKHEVAMVLLENKAEVQAYDGDAWRGAVISASIPTIEVMLAAGADPNYRFSDGESAVTIAALRGNVDALRLLLDKKGNVNFRNNKGLTAIMYAAAYGHEDVVALLLEKKAALYPLGVNREFVYGVAQQNENIESRIRISELLIKHGASKQLKNRPIDEQLLQAAHAGDVARAKALLDQGADVEVRGIPNIELWLRDALSASMRHPAMCRLLVDRGANVHMRDSADFTALHTGAYEGHPDCIRLLVERGADPNAKSRNGQTALYRAVNAQRAENVAALLKAGAKVTSESGDLVAMARARKMNAILKLLEEASVQPQ